MRCWVGWSESAGRGVAAHVRSEPILPDAAATFKGSFGPDCAHLFHARQNWLTLDALSVISLSPENLRPLDTTAKFLKRTPTENPFCAV